METPCNCSAAGAKASSWVSTGSDTAASGTACGASHAPRRRSTWAAERATERATFGQRVAGRQGVQWMLADCAEKSYTTHLLVLYIAYKMERGLDLRQENSIPKNYIAQMLEEVIDTALQLHGSLGYSLDTPLAGWASHPRAHRDDSRGGLRRPFYPERTVVTLRPYGNSVSSPTWSGSPLS